MAVHAIEQVRGDALSRFGVRALASGIGAAIWAVAVWTIVSGPAHPQDFEIVARCLPALAATALALKGWDWLAEHRFGTYGSLFKFLALMGIAMTVVGLVPLCYWTGRGVLKITAGRLL
jgi:hypothetical protein